jgi:hypothetical protein
MEAITKLWWVSVTHKELKTTVGSDMAPLNTLFMKLNIQKFDMFLYFEKCNN